MNDTASSRKEIISTDSQRLAAENQILRLKNKSQKLQLDALQLELESLRKENALLLTENQILKNREKMLRVGSANPEYKSPDMMNVSKTGDNFPEAEDNFPEAEDNFPEVKDNFLEVEDYFSEVEDNFSEAEDNSSETEDNSSETEDNLSEVRDNLSEVRDNLPEVKDNLPEVKDNIPEVGDSISGVEDGISDGENNITELEPVASVSLKEEKSLSDHRTTPGVVKIINPDNSDASLPCKNLAIIDLDFVLLKVFRRNKNEFGVYSGSCSANNYLNTEKQAAARFLLALNNLYPFDASDSTRNKLIHIAVFQALCKKMKSKRPSILVLLRRAGILLFIYQHQKFTYRQLRRTLKIADVTIYRHLSSLRSMSLIGAQYSRSEGNIFYLNQEGITFIDSILKSIES